MVSSIQAYDIWEWEGGERRQLQAFITINNANYYCILLLQAPEENKSLNILLKD